MSLGKEQEAANIKSSDYLTGEFFSLTNIALNKDDLGEERRIDPVKYNFYFEKTINQFIKQNKPLLMGNIFQTTIVNLRHDLEQKRSRTPSDYFATETHNLHSLELAREHIKSDPTLWESYSNLVLT